MTAMADWLWRALLAAFLVFMLGPLLLVILFSFSSNALISFPLGDLTFYWYRLLFANVEFWSALQNSLIIAAATGLLSTVAGTMAALSLVRFRPAVSSALIAGLTLPVTLPPLLLAVSLVVFFVRFLDLPLSPMTVIAGHVLIAQPFVILIVLARLANFDYASIDAARDLGATRWQAFRKVLLPQISTALIGAGLIAMAISLDDFIIAVFTLGGGNTLSTFIWGKVRTTLDPSINAIACILLVFTVGTTLAALRLTKYRG
jgi:spermidine/putrescine transport system permease protein